SLPRSSLHSRVGPKRSPGSQLYFVRISCNTRRRSFFGFARFDTRPALPCTSPAAPPPDIASTAASPADSSPPSAPPLPPTSSRLRLPAQEPPLASTLVRSSLSSSTRPPLEACSLGDISNEHERGHYHRGTTLLGRKVW